MVILISACNEVFDDDITDAQLEIVAPRDSLATTKTTLTFWWNEVNDADKYRLQIVSTSFDTVLSIPVDTNLTLNKFEVTLNPGRYSWRIKAMNSGTETVWFARKLTIIDSPDLTDQEVILDSPNDLDAFGTNRIKFNWTKLPNATKYSISVKKDSWIGDLVFQSETVYDTISKVFPEGKYSWGVVGINEYSKSKAKSKTFFVDLTAPEKSTLQKPADNAKITGPSTTLEWIHSADLTTLWDSVYVSKDNTFKKDQLLVSEKVTTSSYSFSNPYKGLVYWRVITFDKVGHKSSYSTPFSFTLE